MAPLARPAIAQGAPLTLGLMLPYSGTFAALGENIVVAAGVPFGQSGSTNALRVAVVK